MSRISPWAPPVMVVEVIWAPVATGSRAILPTTWEVSEKAPGRIPSSGSSVRVSEDASIRDDSGMSVVRDQDVSGGRRLVRRVARLPHEQEDPDERDDREEDPDEQDQTIRALQVVTPREACDRWHHCSTGQEARDYTKGLGPLGGNGRNPCVTQGFLQGSCRGSRRHPRVVREGGVRVPEHVDSPPFSAGCQLRTVDGGNPSGFTESS